SQGNAQTARGKSGKVTYDYRLFFHLLRHLANSRGRVVACLAAHYDFHQAHDVHGIEEVHADNLVWTRRASRNLTYRQLRSVSGPNASGWRKRFTFAQQVPLQIEILRSRFYDQISPSQFS